jgi:hypothetical protein
VKLLTDTAIVFLDGARDRRTFSLYKTSSAEKHGIATDPILKSALISAPTAPVSSTKVQQEPGVYRVKINDGLGYLVYKLGVEPGNPNSAAIFHYHWNYHLDLPLTAT